MGEAHASLQAGRWDGRHPRLEVWYQTVTDPDTGTGVWFHHELASVARGLAEQRGFTAVFPADGEPTVSHFEPAETPISLIGRGFDTDSVRCRDRRTKGRTDTMRWDVRWNDGGTPLEVFPRAAWNRELLPGVQIVPDPHARFEGHVEYEAGRVDLASGRGAAAHIYGHGNAERWGWLHADLGGGDLLEIVTAVSRKPGLQALPPRAFVRLRLDGRDLPRWAGLSAATMSTELDLPTWRVAGLLGRHRLEVEVTQPLDRCVAVQYRDPDGDTATCTNSIRADADVRLQLRELSGWRTTRRWHLDATAHAEVGTRP